MTLVVMRGREGELYDVNFNSERVSSKKPSGINLVRLVEVTM
jgi:hypothetical protein